jgi:hypothetical protein
LAPASAALGASRRDLGCTCIGGTGRAQAAAFVAG